MKKWENEKTDDLAKAILELKNSKEVKCFLRDLLTEREILEFGNRFSVAVMLSQNIPYSKIEKSTGMSSTTIARVSKWLNKGMNGYKLVLERLSKHHHSPYPLGRGVN